MIRNYDDWLNDPVAYERFADGPIQEPEYEDDDEPPKAATKKHLCLSCARRSDCPLSGQINNVAYCYSCLHYIGEATAEYNRLKFDFAVLRVRSRGYREVNRLLTPWGITVALRHPWTGEMRYVRGRFA